MAKIREKQETERRMERDKNAYKIQMFSYQKQLF